MLYISQVFYTTCFGIISLPSSGVSIDEISSIDTPDDGKEIMPKHVV
jgi:hypothetical protein